MPSRTGARACKRVCRGSRITTNCLFVKVVEQLSCAQYLPLLAAWAEEVIKDQLWERFTDLHIDVLDVRFKQPGRWVEASLCLLTCFRDIVDESKYEILLAIPLASSADPLDVEALPLATLEERVDYTPPSFYLYPIGFWAFDETLSASSYLPALSNSFNRRVYFKEEKRVDEYCRWLFVK